MQLRQKMVSLVFSLLATVLYQALSQVQPNSHHSALVHKWYEVYCRTIFCIVC